MHCYHRRQQEVLVGPKPAAASIFLSLCLLIHAACNRSSIRIEPISGILDAFQSHQIVALGEGHSTATVRHTPFVSH
jgi:hypothetical protein